MPDVPSALSDLAEATLAAANSALTAAGFTVARKAVCVGEPQIGQPGSGTLQLYVTVPRLFYGQIGLEQFHAPDFGSPLLRTASMDVQVWDCWPVVQAPNLLPDESALTAAAVTLLTETWAVFTGLVNARAAGTFSSVCSELLVGPASPKGPQGGWAAYGMAVQAQL